MLDLSHLPRREGEVRATPLDVLARCGSVASEWAFEDATSFLMQSVGTGSASGGGFGASRSAPRDRSSSEIFARASIISLTDERLRDSLISSFLRSSTHSFSSRPSCARSGPSSCTGADA